MYHSGVHLIILSGCTREKSGKSINNEQVNRKWFENFVLHKFNQKIFNFYETHRRNPFKTETSDPFFILQKSKLD